jgi:hypothetical protein
MEKRGIDPIYKPSIEIWFFFYRQKTGEEYVFDGKSGFHLKQLLKKVETKVKQKGMEPSPENILNSLRGFLFSINDQWILDHLDVSLINSKFNVIYTNAVRQSPFTSASRIDDLVDLRNSKRAAGSNGSH